MNEFYLQLDRNIINYFDFIRVNCLLNSCWFVVLYSTCFFLVATPLKIVSCTRAGRYLTLKSCKVGCIAQGLKEPLVLSRAFEMSRTLSATIISSPACTCNCRFHINIFYPPSCFHKVIEVQWSQNKLGLPERFEEYRSQDRKCHSSTPNFSHTWWVSGTAASSRTLRLRQPDSIVLRIVQQLEGSQPSAPYRSLGACQHW